MAETDENASTPDEDKPAGPGAAAADRAAMAEPQPPTPDLAAADPAAGADEAANTAADEATAAAPGADAPDPREPVAPIIPPPGLADNSRPRAGRRNGSMALLIAGAVTAAAGFAAAWYLWHPGGPLAVNQAALQAQLAEMEHRLAAAESAVTAAAPAAAIAEAVTARQALDTRLSTAETAIADNGKALTALQAKVADLAQRPPDTDPAARTAYENELAAMRDMISSEIDRIRAESAAATRQQEQALQEQQKADRARAVAQIAAALESGADFSAALADLADRDPALPTAALRPYASGVPTLAVLQEAFPDAARAALSAARAPDAAGKDLSGFLKRQLGVRSLTPREGDGTDAVLSRAEAALGHGDLAGALAEIDKLPAAAQPALASWRADAERRQAALDGFTALTGAENG